MATPIIALDVATSAEALDLVDRLGDTVGFYKIGSPLFTAAGPQVIREVRARDKRVFLDLKFHDIPNTVEKAVASAVELDVQMLTIHTSGGTEMMRAAERSARENARRLGQSAPLVLGVTVLTSLDSDAIAEVGFPANVGHQVHRLAKLAVDAGLRGLVCSPLEVADLRQFLPSAFQLVTPGIRPAPGGTDDQKRTLTAKEAIDAGASHLVIGRPICSAADPRKAAEQILQTLV